MQQLDDRENWTRRALLGAAAAAGGVVGFSARAQSVAEPIPQPEQATTEAFISRAFDMRDKASRSGDQPYGAIIVDRSGVIVGQAPSRVVVNGDPTAHAEMEAIRDAARRLGTRDLSNHVLISSSRPCPMCEAAAYWANLSGMVHGRNGREAGRPQLCRRG